MKAVSRVIGMTALALVCLDGHAKPGWVATLEAKPARIASPPPTERPCPTAVGHVFGRSTGLRVAVPSPRPA